MTYRNNFDQSSTGTNIECTCFYDTMRSQDDFNENIEILQHAGNRTTCKAYYIDNGNVPDSSEITFRLEATQAQKEAFLKEEGYTDETMPALEDMAEYILDTYHEKINLLNYQDANEVFAPMTVEPSKNVVWIQVRGYSQGDYAEVAYCPDDLEKAWGNKPDNEQIKDYIHHLFYDTPIYACFTINGDEYDYYDHPKAEYYVWDRDKFLSYVAEKSGVEKSLLEPLLPEQPSHY